MGSLCLLEIDLRRGATTLTLKRNTRDKGVSTSGRGKASSGNIQTVYNPDSRPRSHPLYFFLYLNGDDSRHFRHLPLRRKLVSERRSTTYGVKTLLRRLLRPRPSNIIPTQRTIRRTKGNLYIARNLCLNETNRSRPNNGNENNNSLRHPTRRKTTPRVNRRLIKTRPPNRPQYRSSTSRQEINILSTRLYRGVVPPRSTNSTTIFPITLWKVL